MRGLWPRAVVKVVVMIGRIGRWQRAVPETMAQSRRLRSKRWAGEALANRCERLSLTKKTEVEAMVRPRPSSGFGKVDIPRQQMPEFCAINPFSKMERWPTGIWFVAVQLKGSAVLQPKGRSWKPI